MTSEVSYAIPNRIEEELMAYRRGYDLARLDRLEAKEVALFIQAARDGDLMTERTLEAFCRDYAHPCFSDGPYTGPGAEAFIAWLRLVADTRTLRPPRREAARQTLGFHTGEGARHRCVRDD